MADMVLRSSPATPGAVSKFRRFGTSPTGSCFHVALQASSFLSHLITHYVARSSAGASSKAEMYTLYSLATLLALASALPSQKPKPKQKPLPLLIWHGLGDRYDADGLQSTGKLAEEVHPGTYVYYIRTDDDGGTDRTNTFFGNVTIQLAEVCAAIHNDSGLADPDDITKVRADALGFSQGGQFLRGLIETCEGLSVRSLVTFGSQHNGISEFQECDRFDFLCKGATGLIKGNAWTDYIQGKVVPAQYYRTVNETTGLGSDEYLKHSNFLAHINNEKKVKIERYKGKIAALEKFVMYVFKDDVTVLPKETGWFAEVNETTGEVTPLRERLMYKEDWLGLKKLDEKGGLVFKSTKGKHMELNDKGLRDAFLRYFGREKNFEDSADADLPENQDHKQAIDYSADVLVAADEEQISLWLKEEHRIPEQMYLAGSDLPSADDGLLSVALDEEIAEAHSEHRENVECGKDDDEFPGYREFVHALWNSAKAAESGDFEQKRLWLDEGNRILEQMRAAGWQETYVESVRVHGDDEEFDIEDFEYPDELDADDDLVAFDFSSPCAGHEAKASGNSLSWRQNMKWQWRGIWLPWLRGESPSLCTVERRTKAKGDL